jgi:hypothetical protein
MHFMSKDLAKYAGYKGVEAFQVDQRRYDWPLMPLKRIQGRNRYAFTEAMLAHVIWSLRALGLNGAAVGSMLSRIDIEAFRAALDNFEVGLIDCLGPLKLCHYLLTKGVTENGTETVFG